MPLNLTKVNYFSPMSCTTNPACIQISLDRKKAQFLVMQELDKNSHYVLHIHLIHLQMKKHCVEVNVYRTYHMFELHKSDISLPVTDPNG